MSIEQSKVDELDFTKTTTQNKNVSYEDTIEGCNDILINLYKKLDDLEAGKKTSEDVNLISKIVEETERLSKKRLLLQNAKYNLQNTEEVEKMTIKLILQILKDKVLRSYFLIV